MVDTEGTLYNETMIDEPDEVTKPGGTVQTTRSKVEDKTGQDNPPTVTDMKGVCRLVAAKFDPDIDRESPAIPPR